MSQSSNSSWQGGRGKGQRGQGQGWRGGRGNWRGRWRGRGQYFNNYGNRGGNRGNRGGGMMPDPQSSQSRRPTMVQTKIDVASPYHGWKLYFPDEVYNDHSPAVQKIHVFEKYFLSWLQTYNLDDIELKGSFIVDYKELISDQGVSESLPDLQTELKDMPQKVLACMGLSMHQHISRKRLREARDAAVENGTEIAPEDYYVSIIHARILNYGTPVPLKSLKANYYGKFVSVKGTVVRVSNIKPLCTVLAFECNNCSSVQTVYLPDGKYVLPTSCSSADCRGKVFQPQRSSNLTETIDWQTIRIQEIMGEDQKEAGRIPRTIDCELTHDLVDSCVPGDIVTVSGVVKVNSVDEGRGKNKDKCMFLLYVHANSVNNTKGNKSGSEGLAMDFTMKELYGIEMIQSEEQLFRLLVGSVCPSIYGHELVKAGLVLGLFGGTQKFSNDKNRIPVRGDPHLLIVGDPGLGKSQMLQATANIAPRSVYVCGNTTTTSGLTVTLSKDGGSGDYALEAGALVLADQGCCCIDEFDKMSNQHQALLEAMEQQSISIAKAGIVCSLPARTSILAAANPVGGHYNKAKTVAENLKMGSALLSRFDLVFILLDKPDEEMDSMLSEHVMSLHAKQNRKQASKTSRSADSSMNESLLLWESDKPLSERLKIPRNHHFDPIPAQLLRKYVGYARKYVHPKIGPEAAKAIQNFYLELRKQHQTQDSTPITTRQLESMIRLTEARARLELREVATKEDADDVIEIMKYSMVDTYSDQFGGLDFRRSQHGSGMSGRSQPKKFIAALQRISDQTYNSIFTIQQMQQIAKDLGMNIADFGSFVGSLNTQGFLLKKGPKVYQLQTTDY
ncbi:DNA helicase MCM8-like [Mercenaria mercenaria]|uniref:DNA helicase MCM8-like n=1 Tax=Mercenaria mercenaria TaxID=6596 RepID=UPI00234F13F2|nr:DNA helicase MCM8-like [Mercenaria mercenaria]XP_053384110.1 DNA helicase MCM8-like [Mercenaria mercenaria]